MPYFFAPRDSRRTAQQWFDGGYIPGKEQIKEKPTEIPEGKKLLFWPDYNECRTDHRWLMNQFNDGAWTKPVWHGHRHDVEKYYSHIPKDAEVGMVHYFPDHMWIHEKRSQAMTVGKYLRMAWKELGYWDVSGPSQYNEKDLLYWTERIKGLANLELRITQTRDEAMKVYREGPPSCMAGKGDDVFPCGQPSQVYAEGDLKIAYLEIAGSICARALVWPEKKIYGRMYGESGLLEQLLRKEGFKPNGESLGFQGARLPKIPIDQKHKIEGWLMPYVDHYGYVEGGEDGFFLHRDLPKDMGTKTFWQCQHTRGYITPSEGMGPKKCQRHSCQTMIPWARSQSYRHCEPCAASRTRCIGCGDQLWPDDAGVIQRSDIPLPEDRHRRYVCGDCHPAGMRPCRMCDQQYNIWTTLTRFTSYRCCSETCKTQYLDQRERERQERIAQGQVITMITIPTEDVHVLNIEGRRMEQTAEVEAVVIVGNV